ncbi:unnamed protein product [Staurois parvus]|uniref:Uncharacterized protein n=1 Tax=Staurois parvus TaxID=386267 RepID=A0ABN9BQP0_9NEOB|nr:unnamed protein product [Staurois parvus]
MQTGKYRSPGNCQIQTHPSDCQTEKIDLSLQRTCLHFSRVQWVACFTPLHRRFCIALGDLPLTVDHGIFSSKEISRMDLLHRWQPITVPSLNSLRS